MTTEKTAERPNGNASAVDPRGSTDSQSSASSRSAPNASAAAEGIFRHLGAHWAEVQEYVGYLIATRIDALKLSVRSAILYGALGIVGLLAAVAAVATAVVLLLIGAANAISALLGGYAWAGQLIVGLVVLIFVFAAAFIAISKLTGSSRHQTVKKYESRKRQQRFRFGHDVGQRAGGDFEAE